MHALNARGCICAVRPSVAAPLSHLPLSIIARTVRGALRVVLVLAMDICFHATVAILVRRFAVALPPPLHVAPRQVHPGGRMFKIFVASHLTVCKEDAIAFWLLARNDSPGHRNSPAAGGKRGHVLQALVVGVWKLGRLGREGAPWDKGRVRRRSARGW